MKAVRKLAEEDPDTRRSKWQRACYQVLRPAHADGALRHLRRRLDRWDVKILQGRRVGRAVLALRALSTQVPPRVLAAVLRAQCNGLVTGRRFQQNTACCFGCSVGDGVEHYAVCPVVRSFSRNKLDPLAGLHDLLLLSMQPVSVPPRPRGVCACARCQCCTPPALLRRKSGRGFAARA